MRTMLICFYASNASMLPGGVQEGGRGGFGTVNYFARKITAHLLLCFWGGGFMMEAGGCSWRLPDADGSWKLMLDRINTKKPRQNVRFEGLAP